MEESNSQNNSGPKKPWQPATWQNFTPFSLPGIGQFFPHFGVISSLNWAEKPWRKIENPLEKIQKIQWTRRPEIAEFCPLLWSNVSWAILGTTSGIGPWWEAKIPAQILRAFFTKLGEKVVALHGGVAGTVAGVALHCATTLQVIHSSRDLYQINFG